MGPNRPVRRRGVRRLGLGLLLAVVAAAGSGALAPVTAPAPPAEPATPGPTAVAAPSAGPPSPVPTVAVAAGVSPLRAGPAVPTGSSATAAMRAALSARLERLRDRYAIPGISATVIFADGSRWSGASGLADVAGEEPVTTSTAFAIASISKTFTGALVLALADEGALDLDDRVRTHLPDLAVDARITVRQLLDHTSGLADYFFHPAIDRRLVADKGRPWDAAEALRHVGRPRFVPGTGWHYSNTNYLLLGLLAEAVDGRPVEIQLRERFIDPLGLDRTWYQAAEPSRGPLARGYRLTGPADEPVPVDLGDGSDVVPFTSVVTATGAAGSLAASSGDVARWVRALYGGAVLAPGTVDAMIAGGAATDPFRPRIPYGLGVQLVTVDGRATLGHSGRLAGFRSVVRYFPVEGIAVAVLTNQTRTDPAIVARALARIALGAGSACGACPAHR